MKKIGINAILNGIRQILTVLFPLITIKYVIKIVGVENVGKVNYGNSIIKYFSLLAMLGIYQYAVREGALRRASKEKFEQFASQIFSFNVISTILSYILLGICIITIPKLNQYSLLLLLQSSSIILVTMGREWINIIYEDYYLITIRTICTYILTLVIMFLFVRDGDDYYVYASLSVIANGIICISNMLYCRKYAHIRLTPHINIKEHFKPIMVFFANALAVSVYVNIDITMLGGIKGDYHVGLYSLAVKIYAAVKSLLIAIYNVTIAELSYLWGSNKRDEYKALLTKLFGYLTIMVLPATIGLICVSREVLVLLGGKEYEATERTLQILAIALIFAIFGGGVCDCINVTMKREKENFIATVLAAILNFVLNIFMIPRFSYLGAAITTLVAEGFVTMFCFCRIPNIKELVDAKSVGKTVLHSIACSPMIVFVTFIVKRYILSDLYRLIIIIPVSALLYFATMFLIKDKYTVEIVNLFLRRIKRIKG